MVNSLPDKPPVVLITGAAHRIGAAIAKHMHHVGFNVALHYNRSENTAKDLAEKFNRARSHSAVCLKADLNDAEQVQQLAIDSKNAWGQINALVNNASSFYATPLNQSLSEDWDNLLNSNVKAAFFLSQALSNDLKAQQGSIVNIIDIYAERPLKEHSIYCIAKAGLAMMTKSLAKELAPHVRVNGVSPGAILWPEQSVSQTEKDDILNKVPMQCTGKASDIARTVSWLIQDSPYVTGQIIAVDGGRNLNI